MEKFKVVIKGQEYETDAVDEEEAIKKVNEHLSKKKPALKKEKSVQKGKDMSNNKTERSVIDYKILHNESVTSLQLSVRALIKDKKKGTWEPIGGVSITDYQGKGLIGGTSRYEYAQAMACYYKKK